MRPSHQQPCLQHCTRQPASLFPCRSDPFSSVQICVCRNKHKTLPLRAHTHLHARTLSAPSLARPHSKVTLLTTLLYVSSRRGGTSSLAKALPVPTLSLSRAFSSTDSMRHCHQFHPFQWIVNVLLFFALGHMCLPAWDLCRFDGDIQKSVFLLYLYLFKMRKT